jgi:hypothetical protein
MKRMTGAVVETTETETVTAMTMMMAKWMVGIVA